MKKNFEGYWEENGAAQAQDEQEVQEETVPSEENVSEEKEAPAPEAPKAPVDEDVDDEYEDEYEDDGDFDDNDNYAGVDEKTSVLLDKLEELWHAGILTEDEYLKKVNLLLNGSGSIDYENLALKLVAGAALVSTAALTVALIVTRQKAKKQKTRAEMVIERLSGVRGDLGDIFDRIKSRGMDFFNR